MAKVKIPPSLFVVGSSVIVFIGFWHWRGESSLRFPTVSIAEVGIVAALSLVLVARLPGEREAPLSLATRVLGVLLIANLLVLCLVMYWNLIHADPELAVARLFLLASVAAAVWLPLFLLNLWLGEFSVGCYPPPQQELAVKVSDPAHGLLAVLFCMWIGANWTGIVAPPLLVAAALTRAYWHLKSRGYTLGWL